MIIWRNSLIWSFFPKYLSSLTRTDHGTWLNITFESQTQKVPKSENSTFLHSNFPKHCCSFSNSRFSLSCISLASPVTRSLISRSISSSLIFHFSSSTFFISSESSPLEKKPTQKLLTAFRGGQSTDLLDFYSFTRALREKMLIFERENSQQLARNLTF